MGKVQKSSNSKRYTPSSEPFTYVFSAWLAGWFLWSSQAITLYIIGTTLLRALWWKCGDRLPHFIHHVSATKPDTRNARNCSPLHQWTINDRGFYEPSVKNLRLSNNLHLPNMSSHTLFVKSCSNVTHFLYFLPNELSWNKDCEWSQGYIIRSSVSSLRL
jgi:hypothetical protein